MMEIFNEKYFAYVASSYGITFLIFAVFVVWTLVQHRAYQKHLAGLEEQGITRRSASKPFQGDQQ